MVTINFTEGEIEPDVKKSAGEAIIKRPTEYQEGPPVTEEKDTAVKQQLAPPTGKTGTEAPVQGEPAVKPEDDQTQSADETTSSTE